MCYAAVTRRGFPLWLIASIFLVNWLAWGGGAFAGTQVTPSSISAPPSGGTYVVQIISDEPWSTAGMAAAGAVTPSRGTGNTAVTLRVLPNPDAATRFLTISFKGQDPYLVANLQLNQSGTRSLEILPSEGLVGGEGGSIPVQVYSNGYWTVTENLTWLKFKIDGDRTILTVEPNPGAARTGNLIVRNYSGGGDLNRTFSISQASGLTRITPYSKTVAASGGNHSVRMDGGTGVGSLPDWIELDSAAVTSTEVTLSVAPNPGPLRRHARVLIADQPHDVTQLGTAGELLWEFHHAGVVRGTPSVSQSGELLFGSTDGSAYCLDALTGAVRWSFAAGGPISTSLAIGADGLAFLGTESGELVALSLATGQPRWRIGLGSAVRAAPALGPGGKVFGVSSQGRIMAVNAETGSVIWAAIAGANVTASPAVGPGGDLYLGTGDNRVLCFDGETGASRWSYAANAFKNAFAIGADGGVLAFGDTNRLCSFNATSGEPDWWMPVDGSSVGVPVTDAEGNLLLGVRSFLQAVRSGDLGTRWRFRGSTVGASSPAIGADGVIYDTRAGRRIAAIDPQTGLQLWDRLVPEPFSSAPVLGPDGTLYAGTEGGRLVAIRTSGVGLAPTSWASEGGNAWSTRRAGPQVYLGTSQLQFPSEGGTHPVSVSALGDWEVTRTCDWLSISQGTGHASGQFLVSCLPNPHADARQTELQIGGEILRVFQAGAIPTAAAAVAGLEAPGTGGTFWLPVSATCPWQISGLPEWLVVSAPGGEGSGGVRLTAAGNPLTIERTALLNIGSTTVRIRQEGRKWGEAVWTYTPPLTSTEILSSPVFAPDGTVFASWLGGAVARLNGLTGLPIWELALPSGCGGPPVLADSGVLYITRRDNRIQAVDAATGLLLWESEYSWGIGDGLALGPDGLLFATGSSVLVGLDAADGRELWSFWNEDFYSWFTPPIAGADGSVYIGGQAIRAFDGATGALLWEHQTGEFYTLSSISGEGVLYAISGDQRCIALRSWDGAVLWETAAGSSWEGPVIDSAGRLILSSPLHALDPATGETLWATGQGNGAVLGSEGRVHFKLSNTSWREARLATAHSTDGSALDLAEGWIQARTGVGPLVLGPQGQIVTTDHSTLLCFAGTGSGPEDSAWPTPTGSAGNRRRGRDAYVRLGATEGYAGSGGGYVELEIRANTDWQILGLPDWATVASPSGSGNGAIGFTVAPNPSGLERNATLTVSGRPYSLRQAGEPDALWPSSVANFSGYGGAYEIALVTGGGWTVEGGSPWARAEVPAGNGPARIRIVVDGNETTRERSAIFQIAGCTHTLTQAGVAPYAILSGSKLEVGPSAGQIDRAVSACGNWTLNETASWLTVTNGTGTGSGNLALVFEANPTTGNRQTTLSLVGEDGTRNYTFTQLGAVLEPTSVTADVWGGQFTVHLAGSGNWAVSESLAWTSVTPSSGSDSASLTIQVDANPGHAFRSGTLWIAGRPFPLSQTGLLTQPRTQYLPHGAASYTVNLTAAGNWTLGNSAPWVTIHPTSGTGNAVLGITIEPNPSSTGRSFTASFANNGNATHYVYQQGAPYSLLLPSVETWVGAGSSVVPITVVSNGGWTAAASVPWARPDVSTGTGNATVWVRVEENRSSVPREARVAFGPATHTIRQSGRAASFEPSSVTVASGPTEYAVQIHSTGIWSAFTDAPWVRLASASGTGATRLEIALDSNPTTAPRDAVVWIAGEAHRVRQLGTGSMQTLWNFAPESQFSWRAAALGTDGGLYYGTFEWLYSLDPLNGTPLWSTAQPAWLRQIVAHPDGYLLVTLYDSTLRAVGCEQGDWAWSRTFNGTLDLALAGPETAVVSNEHGEAWGFDLSKRTVLWSHRFPGALSAPAVGLDGRVHLAAASGDVYALEPATGALLWNATLSSLGPGTPIVLGPEGNLYLATLGGNIVALSAASGAKRWERTVGGYAGARVFATFADGTVLAGNGTAHLCLDPLTGTTRWQQAGGNEPAPVVGADGKLYSGLNSALHRREPLTGTTIEQFAVGSDQWLAPLLDTSGRLYVFRASQAPPGTAYSFAAIATASPGLAESGWPRLGHDNANTGRLLYTILSPVAVEIGSAGQTYSVQVRSNLPWQATWAAPWLSALSGEGVGNGNLTLQVGRNSDPLARFDTVRIGNTDHRISQAPFNLPSDWLATHFSASERESPQISGAMADPDGDGDTNFAEYVGGLDPRDPLSRLRLSVGSVDVTGGSRIIRLSPADGTRRYHLLESTDLSKWMPRPDVVCEVLHGEAIFILPPSDQSRSFFRVLIERQ